MARSGFAAEAGWRAFDAGDLSFEAPISLRAPADDQPAPQPVDAARPDWTFTLTDRPDFPDLGATLTFNWSGDVDESPTGALALGRRETVVGGHPATRVEWSDSGMGWRGLDVVVRDVSPDGALLKVTCHSIDSRWAETAALCERIVGTIRLRATLASRESDDGSVAPQGVPSDVSGSAASESTSSLWAALIGAVSALVLVLAVLIGVKSWRRVRPPLKPAAAALDASAAARPARETAPPDRVAVPTMAADAAVLTTVAPTVVEETTSPPVGHEDRASSVATDDVAIAMEAALPATIAQPIAVATASPDVPPLNEIPVREPDGVAAETASLRVSQASMAPMTSESSQSSTDLAAEPSGNRRIVLILLAGGGILALAAIAIALSG